VLTTHSMEEAEALCQRIGIVVKGELKCIGSSQYLKEKFGKDYTLEVKIDSAFETEFLALIDALCEKQAVISEKFLDRFIYSIPRSAIQSLDNIFAQMEQAQQNGIVVEYSFSQCSLEQIFIQFAKQQEVE